jgi:hypothetical protein
VNEPDLTNKIYELQERIPRLVSPEGGTFVPKRLESSDRQPTDDGRIEISFTWFFRQFKDVKGLRDETGNIVTASDVEKKFREDKQHLNREWIMTWLSSVGFCCFGLCIG